MPALTVSGAYCGVETLKRAAAINGADRDALILENVLASSRDFERDTNRRYFPVTATNDYRWPPFQPVASWKLWTGEDLLAVTAIQAAASGLNAVPVAITHYFLEPQQHGPPYSRVEIDLSNVDVFQSGPTPQRAVTIAGTWGFQSVTTAAGTLAAAISSTTATSLTCSDASRIDQGDVVLIDSEAIYVDFGRSLVSTTATLSGAPDNNRTTVSIAISSGALVNLGEIVTIDAEEMLITAIVGNTLTVVRGFDGTTPDFHAVGATVYARRGLTVQRGVNGTTPATHLINAPIVKYQAPADVRRLVRAEAIATFQQDLAGWGRTVGMGELASELQGKALASFRSFCVERYRRKRYAAV